jgi:hypothetical protein
MNGAGPQGVSAAYVVKKFSDFVKSNLFWKVNQCILLKIFRRFGGT